MNDVLSHYQSAIGRVFRMALCRLALVFWITGFLLTSYGNAQNNSQPGSGSAVVIEPRVLEVFIPPDKGPVFPGRYESNNFGKRPAVGSGCRDQVRHLHLLHWKDWSKDTGGQQTISAVECGQSAASKGRVYGQRGTDRSTSDSGALAASCTFIPVLLSGV